MQIQQWTRDGFVISTDRARVDVTRVHQFLQTSYWAAGIPLEVVQRACANSLPFGIYARDSGELVGFARVTTDFATFAYIADVFVSESTRGLGLGKWLMTCIMAHPELRGLRRWLLATRDAHGLYAQSGFKPLGNPSTFMEVNTPDLYRRGSP
ncbi:GNAT family N-acetyltransferase [Corallococcus sp. H22C18031201]|nr:GNAT family N-acetyltransferase [Corallococcus sp. H22C18031201]